MPQEPSAYFSVDGFLCISLQATVQNSRADLEILTTA